MAIKLNQNSDGSYTVRVISGTHTHNCETYETGETFQLTSSQAKCYIKKNTCNDLTQPVPPSDEEPDVVVSQLDGEVLCEVCATVDGVPQWVTPYLCADKTTGEMTTTYLTGLGAVITGEVIAVDPAQCDNCE